MLDHNLTNKNEWEEHTDKLRQEILEEFEVLTKNLGQKTATFLLVGGGLALAYMLTRRVVKRKQMDKVATPSGGVSIKKIIKSAVISFVLTLGKDKIIEFFRANYGEPAAAHTGEKQGGE